MIVATACTKWKFEFLSLRSLVLRKESNTSDCHCVLLSLFCLYEKLPYMTIQSAGSGHLSRLRREVLGHTSAGFILVLLPHIHLDKRPSLLWKAGSAPFRTCKANALPAPSPRSASRRSSRRRSPAHPLQTSRLRH